MSAFLRPYGVAATIPMPVVIVDDTDLATSADWTPATGDVKVSKDGGALANVATLPAWVSGSHYVEIELSATEMEAARVVVEIIDDAIEHQFVTIETYGNASAEHETFPVDVTKISGSATAADNLESLYAAVPVGTVGSGSTITSVTSNRTEANDFWNGAALVFTSGSLIGITCRVQDYANSNGTFTVTTLPSAPSSSDKFLIIGRIE